MDIPTSQYEKMPRHEIYNTVKEITSSFEDTFFKNYKEQTFRGLALLLLKYLIN